MRGKGKNIFAAFSTLACDSWTIKNNFEMCSEFTKFSVAYQRRVVGCVWPRALPFCQTYAISIFNSLRKRDICEHNRPAFLREMADFPVQNQTHRSPTITKRKEHTMKQCSALCTFVLLCALAIPAQAQFRDLGLGGGIGFGGIFGQTDDLVNRDSRFLARAFIRYGIVNGVQGEVGAGLGRLAGSNLTDLNTAGSHDGSTALSQLVPVDFRLILSPFSFASWNPYLYAGVGAIYYNMEEVPGNADPAVKTKGWSGFAPGGLGLQFRLDDHTAFELSGGLIHHISWNPALDDQELTVDRVHHCKEGVGFPLCRKRENHCEGQQQKPSLQRQGPTLFSDEKTGHASAYHLFRW